MACGGPFLAAGRVGAPVGENMMIWLVTIAMAVIGGFWVKFRRQRKAKENPYVPN
jgi:hypothetical protein